MFTKLFGTHLRRIGCASCAAAAAAAATASVPASNTPSKHDMKHALDDLSDPSTFLSKWEDAFTTWNTTQTDTPTHSFDPHLQSAEKHPLSHSASQYEYDLKLLDDIADDFVLFHGTNCIELTTEVGLILQKPISPLALGRFSDGEISVQLGDTVRGKSVFIIQSTATPVHENLMELLLTISAARRASAFRITAIIPYFGYSRSDSKKARRETIAASDIAQLFEAMGVDQIITVDLHRRQLQGFFEHTNVESLESLRAVIPVLAEKELFNPVICCASDTGVERAQILKSLLHSEGINASIAFITTKRKHDKTIEFQGLSSHHVIGIESETEIVGQVRNHDVIILDDMIDTGSRIINAAKMCKQNDAFRIFAFATHGIFSDNALAEIRECAELDEVFVTNTIYPPRLSEDVDCDKLSYISIGPIIAEAIRRIQIRNSLSSMTHIER